MVQTIGVLIGGSDCPGINAVLRAIVKTAEGKHGLKVIGYKDGFKGLVENEYMRLTSSMVSGLLDLGGSILGTSSLDNPLMIEDDDIINSNAEAMVQTIKDNLALQGIKTLLVMGGINTVRTSCALKKLGVDIILIPKSFTNEIAYTDYSLGHMTAVETACEAISKLHSSAESHHRIMILEVLGVNSGWISLEAGIAAGADVILIPEIPYNINKIARAVMERKNAGKNFTIIVASQGARSVDEAEGAPERLGSVGETIERELEEITGFSCEVTVLGSLLKGGRPNPYDRLISTQFGIRAVDLAVQGEKGKVLTLDGKDVVAVPIEDVSNIDNKIEKENELVIAAKSIGVSFGI